MKHVLALILFSFALGYSANAALFGTRTVGPSGDYPSITGAIADLQAQSLGGPLVLELQATYVSTVESFPLAIPVLNGASAVNTLTIRPATGATALAISSANATAATVDLNGAQFVTIDGRPGGVGSNAGSGGGAVSQLTIANTSSSGVTLRFINEASSNTLRYTTLRGVNTSSAGGTIAFSTTTGANGNDNNTIDHCDLGDGASTPANGLYALGSTGTTAQSNSGNTVSNCNVFNFYRGVTAVAGVRLGVGNTDWTLTGNSFYQTVSRFGASDLVAIAIFNPSGNNFTMTGNFIGGSAPNAGGSPWTASGSSLSNYFQGIRLFVGSAVPSSVQGNTIANIAWLTSSISTTLPGIWCGIYVQAGSVNIGTVTGNTVGGGTGTGSISLSPSGTSAGAFGIGSASAGAVAIANNTIAAISITATTTSSASLVGIEVGSGVNTISNNSVGSTTTANSLNANTFSTSTTGQQVTGIRSSSPTSTSITGNTVANLNNNYSGTATAGQVRGIVTSDGLNTITGNTVRNLSTASQNADSASAQSVYGIINTSFTAGQTVSQNIVHSLANTAASAAASVTGIYFANQTSGANVIARNFVHSLAVSSTSAASVLNGMFFGTGTFSAQNNMVRVGLKADGTSTAGASIVRGIYDNGTTEGRFLYHNSVYVGGTQTSGASNSAAFQSAGSGNTRRFQNNIFANARGNGGGTGRHYAVDYGVNFSGLTAGGNLFLASGTGGVLGSVNITTLSAWQAATGQDATSAVANPLFLTPAGTAATVNLHLQASNPAEGGGVPIATVADDFDGQPRGTLSPVDIGADAGSFTRSGDIFAPAISYPLLTSGSTASRVLTGWATITDGAGVATGASAPRLYFKKSTDADVFGATNNSTANGWKYVTATGSGPYTFTLDYSLINGGAVSVGDTIQYFVVAHDTANQLSSSPRGATASANPPVQNVNAHGAVNTFTIVPLLSGGSVTVGSGGTYPSLSGAGGFFAALNGVVLTGDLVVKVTTDLTETGSVKLNQFNATEYPAAGNHTLTIQPDSATMRTISGSVSNSGLITFNGADRVTIDGSFGGGGRYLTFRNTSTGLMVNTVLFINDASDNILRNCVVEGAGSGVVGNNGVIFFSASAVTGNDNNVITGCQVRDLSTAAGVPQYLIASNGSSAAGSNSGNAVADNELFNFNFYGINITATGNDSWTLSGNVIYGVNTALNSGTGIFMNGGGTNLITDNSAHGLLSNSILTDVIRCGGTGTTTIARNRVTVFNVNAATTNVRGISLASSFGSTINVVNNQITLGAASSTGAFLIGIFDQGSGGGVVNVFHNSVVIGGTQSGPGGSWASLRTSVSTHTSRNNLFLNLRTGGTGSHFAAGSEHPGGNFTVSHNVYAGTGSTAANFMDFNDRLSNGGGPVSNAVSFATWQNSTGDTGSSASNPGGNYSSAMFVNADAGDLHLVLGGSVLANALGIPIPGVTDDYDGDVRSATAPTIGSDEFIPPSAFSIWAMANGVSNDPNALGANGIKNLFNFAFGIHPVTGGSGELQYAGTLAGGGTITATGLPRTWLEPSGSGVDFRALFVRRKDYVAAGLTYTPQFSAALATWVNSAAVPAVLADDGVNQIVSVPYPAFIAGKKARFFRISVTLAP